MATLRERFEQKVSPEPTSGCWLWLGCCSAQGYGRMHEGRAHRVAWSLFRGPVPDGSDVLHKCDVPGCVNPEHLFLGDDSANMRDREAKGRARHVAGDAHWTRRRPDSLHRGDDHWARKHPGAFAGERNGNAKLTAEDVRTIRADRVGGVHGKALAARYGITTTQVYSVANGKAWRGV